MEEILIKYLKKALNLEYVKIWNFNVNGSNCYVEFHTDEHNNYKEQKNINIWDMVVFLNQN